jgi:Restriction endonuclease S subunits
MFNKINSKWKLYRLGELTVSERPITYGVVKPGKNDYQNGVLFIRGGDVFNGKINIGALRTITQEVSSCYRRTLLRGGELLISLVGNPGEVAVVPDTLKGANIARQVGMVALKEGILPHYVMYFLISSAGRQGLFAQMTGSVQKVVNLANLKDVCIALPSYQIQNKIAAILFSYDNLIEKNNRRINILEEMAKTIYNEWFVKFRFPGYSKMKIVKSELGEMPEGWEVKDILDVQHWTFINKAIDRYQGKREYFATANIVGTAIVANGDWVTYDEKPSRAQKEPVIYSVWFARMRETFKVLGFSVVNEDITKRIILSSGFAGFKADSSSFPFLYITINSDKFHDIKNQFCTGATQMALTNEGLSKIKVIIPSSELIKQYGTLALPIIDEMFMLQKKNKVLQQTRDLLLPRLISGDLNVENLDIRVDN